MDRTGTAFRYPEEHDLEDSLIVRSSNELHDESIQSQSRRRSQSIHEIRRDRMAPKKSKTRWNALVKSLIFIPPLAISLTILSVNFRNVFWGLPTPNTNTILSALQFAAQLHASMIVASLSAMTLYIIQKRLSSTEGVPLGFISASFNLDTVTYLFRKEFRSLNLKYIILFPIAVALAVLAGPSSAILMIPRLQFWSVENVWVAKGNMDFGVYIQATPNSLYPETLTADFSAPQCAGANASILSECPSYGIRQWMLDDELFARYTSGAPSLNKTIQEGWTRYLVGTLNPVLQGSQSSYLSSSLSNFLGTALIAYDHFLSQIRAFSFGVSETNTIQLANQGHLRARYDLAFRSAGKVFPTRKPLVEVQCNGYPANASSFELPHSRMFLAPWNSEPFRSAQWNIQTSTYSSLSEDLNSTIVNATWVDPEQFGSVKPSLGAIFATPEIYHTISTYDDPKAPWSFFACTFNARWMATQTYLDIATKDEIVYDSFPDPLDAIYGEVTGDDPVKEVSSIPAYIGESWANLLNVPWVDSLSSPTPTNRSILDTIGQKCFDTQTIWNATLGTKKLSDDGAIHRLETNPLGIFQCLQVSLSVYLTDALARAHNSVPTFIVAEGHVKPQYPTQYPSNVFVSQGLYEDPQLIQFQDRPQAPTNSTKAVFGDSSKFTEIQMTMSRYGYGYGFQDSILVYFGTVILMLHAVISVVYMTWILITGLQTDSQAETVGELLVMAMQSGNLSEAGSSVSLNDAKQNPKKLWSEKFGIRREILPSEGQTSGRHLKKIETMVIKRINTYDEKQGASV